MKLLFVTMALTLLLRLSAYSQEKEVKVEERLTIKELASEADYGRKKKMNIKVGSIRAEFLYIAQLTGPNGEEVVATRLGSCCDVKSASAPLGKAPLDMWEINYEGLDEPFILYLNGYDYEPPMCPMGLAFKSKSD